MCDKVKGALSIIFMSIIFFLEVETKHVPALGDYILDFFGIISLSEARSGVHLSVVYFGVLFLISIVLVAKYAINRLSMNRKTVFVIFIVLVISFSFITDATAQHIKRTSDGLLAIGYNSNQSMIECELKDQEIIDFEATFTLINYGKKKIDFFVSLDHPVFKEENVKRIEIFTQDGAHASFSLGAGESREFNINLEKYKISGGLRTGVGYYKTNVSEIVLSSSNGKVIMLSNDNFFGTVLHD